jgi:hypothetical protein
MDSEAFVRGFLDEMSKTAARLPKRRLEGMAPMMALDPKPPATPSSLGASMASPGLPKGMEKHKGAIERARQAFLRGRGSTK